MTPRATHAPLWLRRSAEWLALAVPMLVAASALRGGPRWDEDVAAVRALGTIHVGAEGIASSALSGLTGMLPVGSRLLRAALVGTLATGAASWLLYRLALLSLMNRRGIVKSRDVFIALGAALLCCLAPAWQVEATRVGGAGLAAFLTLGMVWLARDDRFRPLAAGMLLGLVATEARDAGVCALVVLVAARVLKPYAVAWREVLLVTTAAVFTTSAALFPPLLGNFGHEAGLSFGLALELPFGATQGVSRTPLGELGWYFAGFAAFALIVGSTDRSRRETVLVWSALVLPGLLLDGAAARLCAIAGVAQLSAIGTQLGIRTLRRMRLPLLPVAVRLVFLLHLCVLFVVAEDGRQAQSRRDVNATREWTNEAFETLPPGTMLLVDSPEVAWRLWAARVTDGTRPDITLVPSALLGHGRVARQLMATEPRIAGLIRDYAIDGTASELSLSQLADARPLKVELDYDWEKRLLSYLSPDGIWSDVAPHALGQSDRRQSYSGVTRSFNRVMREAKTAHGTDHRTLERVYRDLYHQALVGTALGDRTLVHRILHRLGRIKPDDPLRHKLADHFRERPRGAASVRALLR